MFPSSLTAVAGNANAEAKPLAVDRVRCSEAGLAHLPMALKLFD